VTDVYTLRVSFRKPLRANLRAGFVLLTLLAVAATCPRSAAA
jgi:hypothetical protein